MAIVLAVLGVASAAYGVMVMMIRSGSSFYMVWYALSALLLGGAWAVHSGAWQATPAAARRAVGAVIGLALAVVVATQCLVATQFNAQGEDGLDYIVVLGAQVHADGRPSVVLRHRLDAAADYLQRNPNTTCIVSGGQGPNETMPEAQGMAAYLEQAGIAADRILQEPASRNTTENIANSLALMASPASSVGIVTNNFHVYRSVKLAQAAGMENACGIAAYSNPRYLPNNLLRETFGIVKDALAGNL